MMTERKKKEENDTASPLRCSFERLTNGRTGEAKLISGKRA